MDFFKKLFSEPTPKEDPEKKRQREQMMQRRQAETLKNQQEWEKIPGPNFADIIKIIESMVSHLGGREDQGTGINQKFGNRINIKPEYMRPSSVWHMTASPREIVDETFSLSQNNGVVKIKPTDFKVMAASIDGVIIPNFYGYIQPNNRIDYNWPSQNIGDFFELYPNFNGNIPVTVHYEGGRTKVLDVKFILSAWDSTNGPNPPLEELTATSSLMSKIEDAIAISFDLNTNRVNELPRRPFNNNQYFEP